jgi:hypothetical protein
MSSIQEGERCRSEVIAHAALVLVKEAHWCKGQPQALRPSILLVVMAAAWMYKAQ